MSKSGVDESNASIALAEPRGRGRKSGREGSRGPSVRSSSRGGGRQRILSDFRKDQGEPSVVDHAPAHSLAMESNAGIVSPPAASVVELAPSPFPVTESNADIVSAPAPELVESDDMPEVLAFRKTRKKKTNLMTSSSSSEDLLGGPQRSESGVMADIDRMLSEHPDLLQADADSDRLLSEAGNQVSSIQEAARTRPGSHKTVAPELRRQDERSSGDSGSGDGGSEKRGRDEGDQGRDDGSKRGRGGNGGRRGRRGSGRGSGRGRKERDEESEDEVHEVDEEAEYEEEEELEEEQEVRKYLVVLNNASIVSDLNM